MATRPILVVDDQKLNRDMLSRRLMRAGFEVEEAANGPQALRLIEKHEYELILLDNMMPDMSGIDLLKLVRATHSASELPVIMVAAISNSKNVVEALSLGANDYVTKPIDFPAMLARIQTQIERRSADQELRKNQERYTLAVRGTSDGIWDWDLRLNTIYLSPRWWEILGCGPEMDSNNPEMWFARVQPDDQLRLRRELAAVLAPNGTNDFTHEHRMMHRDGTWRWVSTRGRIVRDNENRAVRMAGIQTDVTRDRTADALTGLANRLLFADILERALARYRDDSRYSVAVLLIELNGFQLINDSLGYAAGDNILREIARRLGDLRYPEQTVARMGGDEFALLVPGVGEAAQAAQIAARIQQDLQLPIDLGNRTSVTTTSIGIAVSQLGHETVPGILSDADTALYKAKLMGKGFAALFEPQMREQAMLRLDMESDLRNALERGELAVFYQTKENLKTNRLAGFEALVRWRHPVRGMIMPGQFIPIAEETGLIVPIGMWVLRQACNTVQRWQIEHVQAPPLGIAVNLSVRQLGQPGLVKEVKEIIRESMIDPACLRLEVTESVFMNDDGAALAVLRDLEAIGVGLEIDDFGTGYSSLNYLTSLPFEAIKIDRSFITNMNKDSNSLEVVKTIISLAHGLGKEVIAEGIETIQQLEQLQTLGCDFGQGYLFSKPVDAAMAAKLISRESRYWI